MDDRTDEWATVGRSLAATRCDAVSGDLSVAFRRLARKAEYNERITAADVRECTHALRAAQCCLDTLARVPEGYDAPPDADVLDPEALRALAAQREQ